MGSVMTEYCECGVGSLCKKWDRPPGGIEPLAISSSIGLKPIPQTTEAQLGRVVYFRPVVIPRSGNMEPGFRQHGFFIEHIFIS